MIDEKGRIFGLINVIDLLVLILIVVLAGGYFYRSGNNEVTQTQTAAVKVLCPYLRAESAGQIHEGDQLLARGQLQPVYVTEVKVVNAKDTEPNDEGKIILQDHPFRKDVYLTLEGPITMTGAEINLAGQQVRAGMDKYIMKTQLFEAEGEILEVKINEK